MTDQVKLIVMGGSWGGIQASLKILKALPANFRIPIVLVLHRMKNAESDLESIFNKKMQMTVVEIEEKQKLTAGHVYLAPPNYHVLFERDHTFSLDASEPVNYSRPSIDVTFNSAAEVYGPEVLGILLSGANKDGSLGLKAIAEKGGTVIVQDPAEAEVPVMPAAGLAIAAGSLPYRLAKITEVLIGLNNIN